MAGGAGAFSGQGSMAKGSGEEVNFQSQMQVTQEGEVAANNFASKPIPSQPVQGEIGVPQGLMGTNPIDRILPSPEEKSSAPQMLGQQAVDGLTRRVAWQKFLQKMKSELDVSAADILNAFQSLTPQELQQSPEKNIEKLVSNLGLNPEQSNIAQQLFKDLIDKTGARPLAHELKNSSRDINLVLMSQRDQAQKKLNDALTKMNEQFFMKDTQSVNEEDSKREAAAVSLAGKAAKLGAVGLAAKTAVDASTLKSGQEISPDLLAQMNPVSDKESEQILNELNLAQGENLKTPGQAQMQAMSGTDVSSEEDDLMKSFEKTLNQKSEGLDTEGFTQTENKVSARSEIKKDLFSQADGGSSSASAMTPEGMSESVIDRTQFSQSLASVEGAEIATATGKPSVSSEDLIQHAQMMVRDGGGEVKVILQPEGLGEVAMKVNVDGDKVHVEMITESDAAKKMLEKGLGDLRGHLQAQQLNLETIKVDTASNLGQQLEQQYEDAQRQQAQQFMEQFRQGNQGFRQDFFELPGVKLYQSQTKTKAPEAEASSGSSRSGQGRRLNLVA